ncbi:MAG: IS110 family transposase [Myxococcota bacterium]
MLHIGIDLGGRSSQICVCHPDGKILTEFPASTLGLSRALSEYPCSRVVLETCAESFSVSRQLAEDGHDVRIVPATLVTQLGVAARNIKTDKRDARALATVSTRVELPSVYIPTLKSREIRATLSFRVHHVAGRTRLINAVRGWMRVRLITPPRCTPATFSRKIRPFLTEHPESLSTPIALHLATIEMHTDAIRELDAELDYLVSNNEVAQRLCRVSGVGPVCSLTFLSFIDTPTRFRSARDLYSYLGLTPSEYSSSKKKKVGAITKAGPAEVRRVLVQSAWSLWRCRPNDPLVRWGQQVAERRGRYTAIVAMARKLAGILWAMWRDGTEYESSKVALPPRD